MLDQELLVPIRQLALQRFDNRVEQKKSIVTKLTLQ